MPGIDPPDTNADELVAMLNTVDASRFSHASAASVSRFLDQAADADVLGRLGGRVVAFGMLRGWQDGYDVPSLGIAVRRDDEGHGYGRTMMDALTQLARGKGATRIRLRVHPDNVKAPRACTNDAAITRPASNEARSSCCSNFNG